MHISRKLLALLVAMCLFMVVACSSSDGTSDGSNPGLEGAIIAAPGLGGTSTTGPLGPTAPGAGTVGGAAIGAQRGYIVRILARDASQRTARRLVQAYKILYPKSLLQLTIDSGEGIANRLAAGEKPDIVLDNRKNMKQFDESNLVLWRPQDFGTLVLTIAVANGNPLGINSLKVFGTDPATTTGICAPDKNCGKTAVNLLLQSKITPAPDVVLPRATDVVNAIADGSIDAAILDSTKVANRSAAIRAVRISPGLRIVLTRWQVTSVSGAPGADSFIDFMFSASGAAVLAKRGLLPIVP